MSDALAFARWLQSLDVQVIGEDVELDKLYDQWSEDSGPSGSDQAQGSFIEITYPDGSAARWAVADETVIDRATEAVQAAVGEPDTVGDFH